MSQSQSFGNFPKRKYIGSPKKSFFSPKNKNKNRKPSESPKPVRTLLSYYSPSPEKKRVRLTPDVCKTKEEIPNTSTGVSVRKDLFDSKVDSDRKDVITISDEDEDDDGFDLLFNCKKKQLFKDGKLENISNTNQLNSESSIRSSDNIENVPVSNVSESQNIKVKFKLSSFRTIDEKLSQELNSEQINNKTEALNDEIDLQEVPELTLTSVQEIIIYSSPKKSPVKSSAQTLEISPTKSVQSIEDVACLVEDVDWWEDDGENNRPSHSKSIPSVPTVSTETTSDCNESSSENKNVNSIKHNNTSQNVNGELHNTVKTSTDDDKIDKISQNTPDSILKTDLIYYIVSTPPAIIAWKTLFVHSQFQNIYNKYVSLPTEEKLLYSRLFQRKYDWIRLDNMKYGFVADIYISLCNLAKLGFVKFFNSETEELSVALNLMQLEEVKKACDVLKLSKKGRKSDMVDRVLKEIRIQPLLKFANIKPVNNVKMKMAAILPKFIKLEEEPRKLFMSFLLISTYAQHKSKDDNRIHIVVDLLFRLNQGSLKELGLPLTPIPIFNSLARFAEYEKSVNLVDNLIEAKKEKKWDEAKKLILIAKVELVVFMTNPQTIQELEDMPSYFRKYTSGANYVYVLCEGIEVLKKFKSGDSIAEVIECIEILLNQNYFRRGKRPHWYCELAMMLERSKKFDELFISLKKALQEVSLTPLGKFMLAQRCEMLIKKKRGLSVPQKNELALLSDIKPYRYSTNTLQAKAMPNVSTNKKQMWAIETDNGSQYTGVEEIVRQHYMSPDGGSYSDGCHDEGRIMCVLALCVFWDIIYYPLEGMFHVRLQSGPLDWGSSAFYENRAEIIQNHIEKLRLAGIDGVMDVINEVCAKCYGKLSLISWELIKPERLPDIKVFLECIGIEPFLAFCDYLLRSYKERSSGLPDLTLWNVNTLKCIFVEVKGPTDKLSHKQMIWLQKFNEIGIAAEVCHVHTLHTGKRDISDVETE